MSLAERVRAFLQVSKPGYGKADTDESVEVANRGVARRYVRGRGPFQHFTAGETKSGSPYGRGRSRQKRRAARERVA